MTEILDVLVRWFGFLWDGRYRIVDSAVTRHQGGDALLEVASEGLRLRFVRDRGQVFLDLARPGDRRWYSIDLVRQLITGRPETSAEVDESYAAFLRDHLTEVERRFGAEWPATKRELTELSRRRETEPPPAQMSR